MKNIPPNIPLGLCQCGCGQKTNISTKTIPRLGHIKGHPVRFLPGHHARGRTHSPEHRARNSASQRGRKLTDETKAKISASKIGRSSSLDTRTKMSLKRKGTRVGEDNPVWRGDNVGYRAIHTWVANHKTKIGICSDCGKEKKTHWSNIDHTYRRDLDDYTELCVKCHRRYDSELRKLAEREELRRELETERNTTESEVQRFREALDVIALGDLNRGPLIDIARTALATKDYV